MKYTVTMREGRACPLFEVGEGMVVELPAVDVGSSRAVCAPALMAFLSLVEGLDCTAAADARPAMDFRCPRAVDPVRFEVEVIEGTGKAGRGGPRGVAALRTIPVFKPLGQRDLDWLRDRLRLENHADGRPILRQGQTPGGLYVIARGEVEVTRRSSPEGPHHVLRHRECFGEVAVLTGRPATVTYRARGEVVLLVIARRDLFQIVRTSPAFAVLLAQLAAARAADEGGGGEDLPGQFAGDLAILGLAELIQTLSDSGRSGVLILRHRGRTGRIGLIGGRVHRIVLGDVEGPEGFYAMLSWPAGEFWFDAVSTPEPSGPGWETIELLLEGMRRLDEAI